ncbi:uncharacterized protein J8A68_004439 [[Candida] subhashii]|uniref:Uncharacterized protein n=1 Tax=[Candida] subhashii TaxID=561895 RepID=A0A8J5QJ63_9ASCO|nr:uncharacterized protein J8A68_004439 [[Candida] subhashii]KAG7662051.1 hypothetical protein J8A68_004439 [[Candida] subhashii]
MNGDAKVNTHFNNNNNDNITTTSSIYNTNNNINNKSNYRQQQQPSLQLQSNFQQSHHNRYSNNMASTVSSQPNNQHPPTDGVSFLDLLSSDMDFEQAYSMYNDLQTKNVIGSFEQLQKVQMLNQQYVPSLPPTTHDYHYQQQAAISRTREDDEFAYGRAQILANGDAYMNQFKHYAFDNDLSKLNKPKPPYQQPMQHQQIQQPQNQPQPQPEPQLQAQPHPQPHSQSSQQQQLPRTQQPEEDFDQFFSTTESDALEKFLDNLANPDAVGDPLQFYQGVKNMSPAASNNGTIPSSNPITQDDIFNPLYELHTMKIPGLNQTNTKKDTIPSQTTAVTSTRYPLPTPMQNAANSSFMLDDFKRKASNIQAMLISPPNSGDEIKKDENQLNYDEDGMTKPAKKKRRTSHKPLLSLEQKRLNHSNSEQKRRQLCKIAYNRCLELIIDLDAFNKLPELSEEQRKSKRARVNKEGLPNLSKHGALVRISNEIIEIKSLNDKLKKLLGDVNM